MCSSRFLRETLLDSANKNAILLIDAAIPSSQRSYDACSPRSPRAKNARAADARRHRREYDRTLEEVSVTGERIRRIEAIAHVESSEQ
jgi:hypothetical protein